VPKKRKRSDKINTRLPANTSQDFIRELLAAIPDEDGFKSQYLKEEILSKYSDPRTTPASVRADSAISKWLSVERQNAETNRRLYIGDVDLGWIHSDEFCSQVRSLISRILGPLQYPSVIDDGVHTNGASTRVPRGVTAAVQKLTGEAHLSESAIKHWIAFASGTRLSSQDLRLFESSKLFTVPKKSDIDRVACKEPEINVLLQKSVGNHIRRRLRRFGIDLNDQSRNQELAKVAVKEKLATIDLSSASDSISRQLVINLLPFEWWSLLDDLRVKSTYIGDDFHELEMFSTMGNGFTFELESLLFYAIVRVVCWRSGVKGRISVYGDDIIAPTACVKRLKRVFDYLGFKMNPKKTHSTGLFRESCGKHYYGGFDVTPFYIRREVSTLPDLISLLNKVLEWDGRTWGCFTTFELTAFHRKWSKLVPRRLHGGIEPSDPTALVTGDLPRHRLVPRTRTVRFQQEAGLSLWFLDKRHAERQALSIAPSIEVSYRTRPIVTLGNRTTWTPYLIEETTQ